jgi:GntR family transcriptional regulator, rspAB operon transcriptional repressor
VLAEDELAHRFAVSRTPVRHALGLLRQEGLVEAGPRRQLVVKKLSDGDRREILLVRSALEQTAVREACAALPLDEVDNLRLLLLRQRRAAADGRVDDFLELDEAFHVAIAEQAGLPRVARMLQQLGALRSVRRLGDLDAAEFAERMVPVIRDHEAILDGIEERDEPAALAALHRHLSDFVTSMGDA